MASTIEDPKLKDSQPQPSRGPDPSVLQDRIPDAWKMPRVLAGLTGVMGIAFVFFSYQPLWHTDIWGHLAYGRMIWKMGSLPGTEPLMPLAEGVSFVDTAWLSQCIGYGLVNAFGASALQFLYAFAITLCLVMMLFRFYRRIGNPYISLAGLGLFLLVDWQQLIIVRPQLAGLACFVALMVLTGSRRWHRINWILIPGLFALWANLHGSFPVGLGFLGCLLAGEAFDVLRRTRKPGAVFSATRVRRYFLLIELAALAVLINPYGWRLYAEVLTVVGNPNLSDLIEWDPLTFRMKQGQAAAFAALLLAFVYRLSPRRVRGAEVLLLVGLGLSALWTSRMILWWAPVAAWYAVLHGQAVWKQWRAKPVQAVSSPRSGRWTVVTVGLIWICFAYTPFGLRLLHGEQSELKDKVSEYTPVGPVEYLNENPPQGQVFNVYEWGDYLLWAGPDNLQVFVASHAHLVPRQVWLDYMRVISLSSGWEDILDRYEVNTVVADFRNRRGLISKLKRNEKWRLGYEDDRGAVFFRRDPI